MSKTIVKQGIEGGLEFSANVPMTSGKSDFEVGMATCAQKWKTDDICKRNSARRFYAEK